MDGEGTLRTLRSIGGIIYTEVLSLLRNRTQAFIFLVVPFLVFLFLAGIYWEPVIQHVPTVILDLDHSPSSREIIEAFRANPVLEVKGAVQDKKELDTILLSERARVAVVIPENFEASLGRGQPVSVLTIIDGSNLVYTNVSGAASAEVVGQVAASLRMRLMSSGGILTEKAERILKTVQFTITSRYNPTYNYAWFLLFGLGINVLQQTYLLGLATIISREREQKTWWQYQIVPAPRWQVLTGKCLPYLFIGLAQFGVVFLLGSGVLGLPLQGNILLLLGTTVVFLLTISAFALLVSALTRPVNSIRFTMVMAMPSFVFSGYTWPAQAMHPLVKTIGQCLPLTWYLRAFQSITMKGAGWEVIGPYLIVLGMMAVVFLMLALLWVKKWDGSFRPTMTMWLKRAGVKHG